MKYTENPDLVSNDCSHRAAEWTTNNVEVSDGAASGGRFRFVSRKNRARNADAYREGSFAIHASIVLKYWTDKFR